MTNTIASTQTTDPKPLVSDALKATLAPTMESDENDNPVLQSLARLTRYAHARRQAGCS